MTEKELRKLNRYQLLELLILQTSRTEELQQQLEEAQGRLNSKDINLTVVGSIAEASVQMGGLLEAAQNTAEIYLNAVQQRVARIEAEAAEQAKQIIEEARQEANRIMSRAYEARNSAAENGMNGS